MGNEELWQDKYALTLIVRGVLSELEGNKLLSFHYPWAPLQG